MHNQFFRELDTAAGSVQNSQVQSICIEVEAILLEFSKVFKKKPVILTFERGKINCVKKYKAKWID